MILNSTKTTYSDAKPYHCKICKKLAKTNYYGNKRMVDKKLCFTCNFWDKYCESDKIKKSIRIDGVHYMLGDKKKPNKWNGFGGRKFKIKMNNGTIIDTCDLWYQGEIPSHFRDKLTDNAIFI